MIAEADGTVWSAFGPLKVQTIYLTGSPEVIAEIVSWSQRSRLTLAEVLKLPRGTRVNLIKEPPMTSSGGIIDRSPNL